MAQLVLDRRPASAHAPRSIDESGAVRSGGQPLAVVVPIASDPHAPGPPHLMSVRPVNRRRRDPRLAEDRSDSDLATAVADGSEPALAEIYRRYGAAVHGTALAVLKDRALAEDVTQLVFVSFWERPDRFDPSRGSLRSLLVSIAHNRGIDVLRSNTSRARREERDADDTRLVAVPDPVAGEAWHGMSSEVLSTALRSLDADQREAIELAYFGGRTYREVATELGVPEGTIKSRIRRGLERLRVTLDSEGLL